MRTRLLLAAAVVLLAPSRSDARPGPHVRLEAATAVPIYVGPRLAAELPGRLRLSTSVGWLPRPYVQLINEIVTGLDGYDERTAEVIEESLSSSLVWRTHAGWRPLPGAGLYFEAGYGLVTLGGGTSEAAVLAIVLGRSPPTGGADRYDVDATLHMLDAELGWEWWFAERVSLRASLGGAFTLDARTSVEPRRAPRLPVLTDAFTGFAERELEELLERYVHTPVVAVAVGYAFY